MNKYRGKKIKWRNKIYDTRIEFFKDVSYILKDGNITPETLKRAFSYEMKHYDNKEEIKKLIWTRNYYQTMIKNTDKSLINSIFHDRKTYWQILNVNPRLNDNGVSRYREKQVLNQSVYTMLAKFKEHYTKDIQEILNSIPKPPNRWNDFSKHFKESDMWEFVEEQ